MLRSRSVAVKLIAVLALSLVAVGCGYGSNYNMMTGGPAAPRITQLSPMGVSANSGPVTLTVTGSNFTSSAVVYWDTSTLPTTYKSTTQLTAAVSASMVANTGSVSIYVHDAGGNSNSMMFDIN